MSFTQVTIVGTVTISNAAPAAGATVTLTLNTPITDGTQVVAPKAISTRCASDGTFSLTVNANDDSTTSPTGTYYEVSIAYGTQTLDSFNVIVPHLDAPTVNLFTLATLPNPNVVSPYVSQLIAGTGVSLSPAGGTGAVTVSSTGALPNSPTTFGAATFNGTSWESDLPGYVDICAEFGVSTSNSDNATAINTALSTLGPLGLTAFISKPGVYNIKSPIVIGNGTSSAFSTWTAGLVGAGFPGGNSASANAAATAETKLAWTGSALADGMVQVIGPLSGWRLANLHIDGGSVQGSMPAYAIHFKSTVRGRGDNLSVSGCQSGIWHDSYAAVSGALTGIVVDDIFNQLRNISISYTGKASAASMGLLFDGGANGVSNTCFNEYEGVWFSGPSSSLGSATNTDIYFKRCDSIYLKHLTFDARTGTDTKRTVTFDWSAVSQWPKGCVIDKVDFGNVSNSQFTSTGTPGGSISHNRFINISSANGQPGNPNLPWLQWGDTAYTGFVQLSSGAATVANTAVQAGSFIQVSILAPGTLANVGTPYVNTRTTGTGFTIASTNASDNSFILWRVMTDPYF